MKELLLEFGAWYFMPVSNGMGNHGVPDFIVAFKGWFIAIETKVEGGKPTSLQQATMLAMRDVGGALVFVVQGHTPEALTPLRAALTLLRDR